MLHFDRFRFDRANQRLEDAVRRDPAQPKAFEVLRVLIERPGQLVLKDQLLDAVWPDTHVGRRGAEGLHGRDPQGPRRLGHRAPLHRDRSPTRLSVRREGHRRADPVECRRRSAASSGERERSLSAPGRREACQRARPPRASSAAAARSSLLEERLARALRGERQVVFVTGEAGAGKTALVEHFVAGVAQRQTLAITGSQCLEQFGSAEAYMPVLEAVGRLVREDGATRSLLPPLRPDLVRAAPLAHRRGGPRQARARRCSAPPASACCARWRSSSRRSAPRSRSSSFSTISTGATLRRWICLSLIAVRPEPARLLVLATYRPVELILAHHPLRAVSQRLATSRRCGEIALDDLGVDAVAEYLERRFAGSRFPHEVARLLRERTGGNPLFLVTLVDHLLARGAIVERDGRWHWSSQGLRGELAAVPRACGRMIEQQLDRLEAEDRQLLEAASLGGDRVLRRSRGRRRGPRHGGKPRSGASAWPASVRFLRARGSRRMARRHGRRVLCLPASAVSRDACGGAAPASKRHLAYRADSTRPRRMRFVRLASGQRFSSGSSPDRDSAGREQ